MRIPTSLVVMSLVTATPFALGIRDVVLHQQPSDRLAAEAAIRDRLERAGVEDMEAQARREAEEHEAAQKAKLARIPTLYGARRASLGALFGDTVLGSTQDFSAATQAAIAQADRDGLLLIEPTRADNGSLEALRIEIGDRDGGSDLDACGALAEGLDKAWGPSMEGVWVDAEHGQRASLTEGGCVLLFTRVLPVDAWLAQVQSAELGKPDPGAHMTDDDFVQSNLPGVGYGTGMTMVTTYLDRRGVRTGLEIDVDTDEGTLAAIRDALSQKLHQQPTAVEDGTTSWTWKKAPGYVMEQVSGSHFSLVIGKVPSP